MGRIVNGVVCISLILIMLFVDSPKGATNDLIIHGVIAIMNLMFVLSN